MSYRQQLGLTQQELSERTSDLGKDDATVGPVSVRTIISLERPVRDGTPRRPRHETAHSLAVALGLDAGTPAYGRFMAAARQETEPVEETPVEDEPAPDRFIEAGREPQLHRLATAIDDAAEGAATALLVRGEKGSGKTSIIAHACRLALDRYPGTTVLWATCPEIPSHAPGAAPHEPFLRVIRLMLGDLTAATSDQLIASGNQRAIAGRVDIAAHALGHEGPLLAAISLAGDARWPEMAARVPDASTVDRLRALARSGPSDTLRVVSGCEQFYRVLRRYAEPGPVILVFDDMHRADPASLASLSHLLNRMHGQQHLPVMLICSAGAEALSSAPSSGLTEVLEDMQRLYYHATVDLADTMTGDAARAFVAAIIAESPVASCPNVVEALLARTDGNPLYLVELLGVLETEGALAAPEALARIQTAVPEALAATFEARMRALPAELQQLLVTASVLGADFYAETLMQMLDLPTARFIELVDRQLGRQHRLLRPDGTVTIGPRTSHRYRFHPPMLRDHLYGQLSDLERAHAHAQAAEALIALHDNDGHSPLPRIAHHFDRAGRRVEAARFHVRAGDHARASRDFEQATAHFQRIAELNVRREDPVTWITALISLGIIARAINDPAAARKHLDHALDLATSHQLPIVQAKALEALGMLDFDAGAMESGLARMTEAIEIWATHDHPDASRAMANQSYILYGLGRYDDAVAFASRARAEATRDGRERSWVDATIALANCWVDLGLWSEATDLYERGLHVCRDLGDHHRAQICWANLSLIAIEQADWGAAEAAIDRIAELNAPVAESMQAAIALYSGEIAEGRGNLGAARDHYKRSLEIRDENGRQAAVIDALAGLLRVASASDDLDAAAELLAELRRRLERRGLDGVERIGRLYEALVQAADRLGRPEEARHDLAEGVLVLTGRAGSIADATQRESFLNRPPAHRWLIEEAARHGVIVG